MSHSVKERVSRYRAEMAKAGMKRVEVFVPEDKVSLLRAYAADLRSTSDSPEEQKVRSLIAKAYEKFHAQCLDNISVDAKSAKMTDAVIVATALMERGNAEAYKLGREIMSLAR